MDAKKLIDEAVDLDAEDLASDYVETRLGRFYFASSWKLRREKYMLLLKAWLIDQGKGEKFDAVVAELDLLADGDHQWNDRYRDDYSGENNRPASQKPKKPRRSQRDGNAARA